MHLNLAFVLCAIVATVRAQDSTSAFASATSSAASSTSSAPFTHTVSVAYAGFTFSPDVTLANVGDIIEFDFYPKNHSVVRAEWGYPCIPYEDTGVDKVGFFSGFEPVDAILSDPPKFTIRVNDTNPVFYYCSAPGSCLNYGMVGVINPNATTPIETQIALAKNSTFMLEPGQPWPSEEDDPFPSQSSSSETYPATTSTAQATSTSASATSSAATTTVTATPTPHSGLSGGAIAGVAIGAAAVALLAGALLYMCGRNSRRQQLSGSQHGTPMFIPNPHMSYIQPHSKHLSTITSHTGPIYGSPALPGYIAQHDPAMSPPLQQAFSAGGHNNSDHITAVGGNGSESNAPSSPSASHQGAGTFPNSGPAPAYHMQPNMIPIYQVPPHGVYEMDTPTSGSGEQGGGILGFIRKSASTKKGAGVERYG